MGNPAYTGARRGWMIAAVMLITVTSTASSYALGVSLPYLLSAMDAMDYYALYAAIASVGTMAALPLVGSMSAKFGARNVIVFGLIAQFASRVALLFCRQALLFGILYCFGGFFLGMYISAPYAVMAELVSPQERPKFFGYITASSAAGALIGPYLTGVVVENISAGAGMLVYVVFAILPTMVFILLYPNSKRPGEKFDLPGMAIFVVFVLCLVLWLSLGGKMFSFISPIGITMPIAAAAALAVLIRRERKIDNPAVPVRMFAYKRFTAVFVVQVLVVAYATCVAAYGIRYALEVMGLDASVSSTVTMPQTIVQFILGLFIGSLLGNSFKKRFRPLALMAIICYAVGLMIFYFLPSNASIVIIYLATGIGGVGQAVVQATFAAFYQTELGPEDIRPAQGMYQFASTGGSSVFTAIIGAAMNLGMGLQGTFLLGTAFILAGFFIAVFTLRFPREEIAAEDASSHVKTSS